GATFLIALSIFPFAPLCNGQVSANTISDTARGAAIATTVMMGNIGGLISGWSFLPWDAPHYKIGNGLNLATAGTVLLTAAVMFFWVKGGNEKRRSRDSGSDLQGLSDDEIQNLEWKHPEFFWRL